VPPPVENGRVPRNRYGNIDVYTRNMIPPGAVHVRSRYGRQAARILGIDFVDAITGFDFQGRQGTAVRDGVVVAAEFKDAMIAVLEGLHHAKQQELEEWRHQRAISLWKRFAAGLKIIARVNQYKDEAEDGGTDETTRDEDSLLDDAVTEDIEIGHELATKDFRYEIVEPPEWAVRSQTVAARSMLSSLSKHDDSGHETPMDDDLESLFDDSADVLKAEDRDGDTDKGQAIPNAQDQDISNEALPASYGTTERAGEAPEHDVGMIAQRNNSSEAGDDTSMLSHDPEDDDADPDWLD
jgi:xeroderma pigmentosum group C-complementing protein